MAEYTGIKKGKSGNYEVSIRCNGIKKNFGTFENAEAAGTVANYYAEQLGKNWHNDTNMDINEAFHYKRRFKNDYHGDMYTLVDETISYSDYIKSIEKEKQDKENEKIQKRKEQDAARYKEQMKNLLKYRDNIPIGKRFISDKYGSYVIISADENINKKNPTVRVKFDYTGYEYNTTLKCAVNLGARDPYYPSICGFGYTGERSIFDPTAIAAEMLYNRWRMMVDRVKNPENKSYDTYGGAGVDIAPEWAYFWNYYNDIINKENFNYLLSDPEHWCIDKDILQTDIPMSQRIYSNDTTCIIRIDDNIAFTQQEFSATNNFRIRKYVGVYQNTAGLYKIAFDVNNVNLASNHKFTDPVAAAAIYDFYARINNRNAMNYVDITVDQAIKFSTNYGKKIMYRLIDN